MASKQLYEMKLKLENQQLKFKGSLSVIQVKIAAKRAELAQSVTTFGFKQAELCLQSISEYEGEEKQIEAKIAKQATLLSQVNTDIG